MTSDREPVILMRLYQRGSLAGLLKRGKPLPVEQALRCARHGLAGGCQSRLAQHLAAEALLCCRAGAAAVQQHSAVHALAELHHRHMAAGTAATSCPAWSSCTRVAS